MTKNLTMMSGEKVKINLEELAKNLRQFSLQETLDLLQHPSTKTIFWCWGANNFRNYNEHRFLRFNVTGQLFTGHVYIALNAGDLYNVYYTTTHGNIVDTDEDIYFEDLVRRIDQRIEKTANYRF